MSECAGVTCDHSSHNLTQEKIDTMGETMAQQFPAKGEPMGRMFTGTDEHDGQEIVSDRELVPESVQGEGKMWSDARFTKPCGYCQQPMYLAGGQDARYHGGECRTKGRQRERSESKSKVAAE